MQEIDKLMLIAEKQKEAKMISHKEYRKIMFLLIDKTEDYMQNLEKISIPKIEIQNYENIDLLKLTNVIFCTG